MQPSDTGSNQYRLSSPHGRSPRSAKPAQSHDGFQAVSDDPSYAKFISEPLFASLCGFVLGLKLLLTVRDHICRLGHEPLIWRAARLPEPERLLLFVSAETAIITSLRSPVLSINSFANQRRASRGMRSVTLLSCQ